MAAARTVRGQGTVTALAFSPDGTKVVSGGEDGTALVWDVKTAAKAEAAKDLDAAWAGPDVSSRPARFHSCPRVLMR